MLMFCVLPYSTGNILEDEAAIEALKESKAISEDIKAKQAVSAQTEKTIDQVYTVTELETRFRLHPCNVALSDPNLSPSSQHQCSASCGS